MIQRVKYLVQFYINLLSFLEHLHSVYKILYGVKYIESQNTKSQSWQNSSPKSPKANSKIETNETIYIVHKVPQKFDGIFSFWLEFVLFIFGSRKFFNSAANLLN